MSYVNLLVFTIECDLKCTHELMTRGADPGRILDELADRGSQKPTIG
jgi:hypothetical protein